jgi:glycosyltransferase involved in cell wall biosynthesis
LQGGADQSQLENSACRSPGWIHSNEHLSMKQRIAILHYSAPPVVGGVESTIAAHARLFADHGYSVKIIAGRGEQFDPRVPVEIIPHAGSANPEIVQMNRELAVGTVGSRFHGATNELLRILPQSLQDADVCIAHNIATLHKNLALTSVLHDLAEAGRVRLIAWCHDLAWDDPLYAGELHTGFPWGLLRAPWAGVRYVVVSEARKRELIQLWGAAQEISVVPPGIEPLGFLHAGETTAEWAREFKLLRAAPLLLTPTRVTRRKNIELAIEITAALCGQGLAPKLLVMGPLGPHNPANREYLEDLGRLQERRTPPGAVILLQQHGVVDDVTRRDLYWLADALLITSRREGFGIPLLEAGLTGLPIFCSDIPPFHESAGENAHFFTLDESPVDIAARLARFLAEDARYQMKQRVLNTFAWDRIFAERIEPLVTGG